MAKRPAERELNHDNWDDPDEVNEHPGKFVPLPAEAKTDRIIKKAKRTLVQVGSEPGKSPFARFSGFSSSSSSPFSFSQQNIKLTSTDQIISEINKKENDKVTPVPTNSAHISKQPRPIEYYKQLQSLNEGVIKWMQFHLNKNPCCDFTPVFNDYKKHMDSLSVTFPVMKDIESKDVTVVTELNSGKCQGEMHHKTDTAQPDSNGSDKNDEATDYGNNFKSNTTNTSTFSFGIQSTPTATSSISPAGPTSSSKQNSKDDNKDAEKSSIQSSSSKETTFTEDKKKSAPFAFLGSSLANTPNFTFGSKSSNEDSQKPTTFSFLSSNTSCLNNSGNAENKPAQFSSGFFTRPPPTLVSTENNSETQEEEYVPPKNEFRAVEEENAVYSKKCKLFYKKNDGFVERGVGMLYLKKLEEKTQLLVRADTNLGNILLNIVLHSSLPMSRTGKNNVLVACVPNPPVDPKVSDDQKKETIPMLIRVKTSEDADELLDKMNQYKT